MSYDYYSNRHSVRLRGYDYAQNGAYYVTICAYEKQKLFGEIRNNIMNVNDLGAILEEEWYKVAQIRNYMILDDYIVMPNHFHGIFFISNDSNIQLPYHEDDKPILYQNSLGSIIGGFKAAVTRHCRIILNSPKQEIWQRSFYDHIIRNEDDLNHCREYIIQNPANWNKDEMFMKS